MSPQKAAAAFILIILLSVGMLSVEIFSMGIPSSFDQVESAKNMPVIAVIGSSLAAGWVTSRDEKFDMKNGWAERLGRHLQPQGFRVINISNPGDTTEKVLDRLEKDLFPLNADIVIISLSLENEGIRGLWEKTPEEVYEGFKGNLKAIVEKCRQNGIRPVIASCYASDNYTEDRHYDFIKKMNLELASWDVPGINLLGALDNGRGRFVPGVTFDLDHPDSKGHRELFYSVVPGLFEAVIKATPLPQKAATNGFFTAKRKEKSMPLSYIPDSPMHSFTMFFETRIKEPGTAAVIIGFDGGESRIDWDGNHLQYISSQGNSIPIEIKIQEGPWHSVSVSHHYAGGETIVFVDGLPAGRVDERIIPLHFILGGSGKSIEGRKSAGADYREWMIYRTALNPDEAASLHQGVLLQPSLELYAPLSVMPGERDRPLKNLAQNTARAFFYPSLRNGDMDSLREKIRLDAEAEKIFVDPDTKQPVEIDPAVLMQLQGVYEVNPQMAITIVLEEGRFFALVNEGREGKMELFPLSASRFFMKLVGPEAEMEFVSPEDGSQMEIVLRIGPDQMKAKRVRLR